MYHIAFLVFRRLVLFLSLFYCNKSNSNGFAFFVWQKMEFANSQINMGRRKKGYLQRFGKIDLRGREERMRE
jgi:hypothetical protein